MKSENKKALLALLVLMVVCGKKGSSQASASSDQQQLTLLQAVQFTLLNHPLLKIQQAKIQISEGLREQASGAFDSVTAGTLNQGQITVPLSPVQQQENAVSGFTAADQLSHVTSYDFGVQKLFRNGISITPQLRLDRASDNRFNSAGLNSSTTSFLVTIPLLRGRGRATVAAQEDAAKTEVAASFLDLSQLISQLMANTISSYWSLVAAQKNLAIAIEAEDRGNLYLRGVQTLVDADHVPHNDLHEVVANLASRSSSRLAAEQQVIAAQAQLALDMGISADRLLADMPRPLDDFPDGEDQQLPSDSTASMQYYFNEALQHRADYLALLRRTAEATVLEHAARNRLQPQINLNLGAGYSGLQQGRQVGGFFVSTVTGVQGPNVSAGLTYSFPGGNQTARGALLQAVGATTQAEWQSRDLARSISGSVAVAVSAVRSAILRVKRARQSVKAYRAALAGEREKYAGGIGSIVDILTVEDKLTTALIDQLQTEQSYALAVVQFRFATGTLVSLTQATQNIDRGIFSTLPFAGTPQPRP